MSLLSRLKLAVLLMSTIGLLTLLFVREGSQFLRAGEEHYNQVTLAKDRNFKNANLAARLIENKIAEVRTAAQAIAHLTPENSVMLKNGRVDHFLKSEAHAFTQEGSLLLYPESKTEFRLSETSGQSTKLLEAFEKTKWAPSSFDDHPMLLSSVSPNRFAIAFKLTDSFEKPAVVFSFIDFSPNFFQGIDTTAKLRLFSVASANELMAKQTHTLNAFVEIPNTGLGVYAEFKPNSFDHFEPFLSQRTRALGICIFLLAMGASFILFGRRDFSTEESFATEGQLAKAK